MKNFIALKKLLPILVASALLYSCNPGSSGSRYSAYGYGVANFSLSGIYFTNDYGIKLIPKSQQGLDQLTGGERVVIQYAIDQDSRVDSVTYNVDIEGLGLVKTVLALPSTSDTIGTDAILETVYTSNTSFKTVTWSAQDYLTTEFCYNRGYNAGKHTFGYAQDGADFMRNDTVRLILWHNTHGDTGSTGQVGMNAMRLGPQYLQAKDSVVVALRFKTEEGKSKTLYTTYKRKK